MEEYNLYKNDDFVGTYDIGKLSMKLKMLPSDIRRAWEHDKGIIDDTYRVKMILNPRFSKPGERYPACEQGRSNCFAYNNGLCTILVNTEFPYDCHFFKTEKGA